MNAPTHIDDLWVADWPKSHDGAALPVESRARLREHGMLLDTCLRQLFIAVEPSELSTHVDVRAAADGLTLHFGIDAYRYLLEVATGLRSQVPAETNVFGQLKHAWERHRRFAGPGSVARMAPWMHRLINDARSIRREHLDGIGGASYGSLVRRLIGPRKRDRVLFVGAGRLAQSILPFFDSYDTGVWNRSPIDTGQVCAKRLFASHECGRAAYWADHVVMATPADDTNDERWRTLLAGAEIETILHLGHPQGGWAAGASRVSLGLQDVFALRSRQEHLRGVQLERARMACVQSARDVGAAATGAPLCSLLRA